MMKLEEARAKFPVGSMVKITDIGHIYSMYKYWAAHRLSLDDYNDWEKEGIYVDNGDIGEVICVDNHDSYVCDILVAVRVKGKKIFLIKVDGIEPLEDEIPFSEEPPSSGDVPFDVHNEDEFEDQYRRKPEFKLDGKTLIVEAFGRRESLNLAESIDEMVDSCKLRSQLIEVGDKVQILDPGDTYPAYEEFVKKYLCFEQAMFWQYDRIPKKGAVGKVIIKKPSISLKTPICVIQMTDIDTKDHIYLIHPNGLKKVESAE